VIKFVLLLSKGLIRDQRARRQIMFYSVLGALVMLFLGATLLFDLLRRSPLLFMLYWFACAWITLLAVLLALFDLLLIRAAGRRERRQLESEYLANARDPSSVKQNGSNPTGT
jgi:protein-S-isoprenylcysteine O-methyltransferase Ste14